MFSSSKLVLALSYLFNFMPTARQASSRVIKLQEQNTFGDLNTTSVLNPNSNVCRMNNEKLRLVYSDLGDDIKPAAFNRLIVHARYRLTQVKDGDDWDTMIGLDPIRWGHNDYWLYIVGINEWLTWHWVKVLLGLLEFCYMRGHVEEFDARLYYGSARLGRVRLYFYRDPDVDRAIA